jgi:hypothetical protein
MLHVRVVTTPGLTGRLLDRLAGLPGIRNLVVLEGAVRPSGDAVFFDVDHSALLLNVVLLIVVGAGGLSARRALWARRDPQERPG